MEACKDRTRLGWLSTVPSLQPQAQQSQLELSKFFPDK